MFLLVALNAQVSALPLRHPSLSEPSRPSYIKTIKTVAQLPQPAIAEQSQLVAATIQNVPSSVNTYAWGNCTWGVANWTTVPSNLGNANTWDDSARLLGYTVSGSPIVGAVAQTDSDSYLGHVALVEAVNGDQILIKEMNAQGLGVVDERWTSTLEFPNFIYF